MADLQDLGRPRAVALGSLQRAPDQNLFHDAHGFFYAQLTAGELGLNRVARLGTAITGLDSEARRLLYEHPWPGNVRELENTIERAMVLAEGDQIVAQDLPERLREARDPVQAQLASGELSVKKTMRIVEEILIRRALQRTKGNRTRAAEVLEISHRALLYKIKDYQITDL